MVRTRAKRYSEERETTNRKRNASEESEASEAGKGDGQGGTEGHRSLPPDREELASRADNSIPDAAPTEVKTTEVNEELPNTNGTETSRVGAEEAGKVDAVVETLPAPTTEGVSEMKSVEPVAEMMDTSDAAPETEPPALRVSEVAPIEPVLELETSEADLETKPVNADSKPTITRVDENVTDDVVERMETSDADSEKGPTVSDSAEGTSEAATLKPSGEVLEIKSVGPTLETPASADVEKNAVEGNEASEVSSAAPAKDTESSPLTCTSNGTLEINSTSKPTTKASKSAKRKSKKREAEAPSQEQVIPRGVPKSGRFWKMPKEKFSKTIRTKGLKSSFEKKMEKKQEWKKVQGMEREMKEAKKQEKEEVQRKQEERKKMKLENERKAEVVQVIKNPAKIKRMKKKQLRMIAKRDTTQMVKSAV